MTEEFNVDSKAECDQLNLAIHVARNKKNTKQETKTTTRAHLVKNTFKIRERSPNVARQTTEERISFYTDEM